MLSERARIAREIHDTLLQNFVSAIVHLDIVDQLLKAHQMVPAGSQVAETRNLMAKGLDAARCSISDLREDVSVDFLASQFKSLVAHSEFRSLPAEIVSTGQQRAISRNVQKEIVAIVRETLRNVLRHAAASRACVYIVYTTSGIDVNVTDDGRGFDSAQLAEEGHYGMHGMRERAEKIGGNVHIHSSASVGTTVRIHAPERVMTRS